MSFRSCTPRFVFLALIVLGCGGSSEMTTGPFERVSAIDSNIKGQLVGEDSLHARAWALDAFGHVLPDIQVSISALTPELASINSVGMIHAHGDGVALFLASTAGLADTLSIQVFGARVDHIVATPDSVGLVVGDSLDVGDEGTHFAIHVFDASGHEVHDVPVFVTSSDQRVVFTYSDYFDIIARAAGTCVLTATAGAASTTIKVTVRAP